MERNKVIYFHNPSMTTNSPVIIPVIDKDTAASELLDGADGLFVDAVDVELVFVVGLLLVDGVVFAEGAAVVPAA
jgi:hypothetical protein